MLKKCVMLAFSFSCLALAASAVNAEEYHTAFRGPGGHGGPGGPGGSHNGGGFHQPGGPGPDHRGGPDRYRGPDRHDGWPDHHRGPAYPSRVIPVPIPVPVRPAPVYPVYPVYPVNPGYATYDMSCESYGDEYKECYLPRPAQDAYVVNQLSSSQCVKGYTFGVAYSRIWVTQGCRAIFRVIPAN